MMRGNLCRIAHPWMLCVAMRDICLSWCCCVQVRYLRDAWQQPSSLNSMGSWDSE